MGSKIALLVIFNHRYDKNIPILEEMYRDRFSNIFFVVPFYDGNKDNVIPVYDSSYRFQNYIAQAYQHIRSKGFSHYFWIADDMILNPQITEDNLFSFTGISPDACWINDLRTYRTHPQHYRVPFYIPSRCPGIEVSGMLPTVDEVRKRFDRYHLDFFPSRWYTFLFILKHFRFSMDLHRNRPVMDAVNYLFRHDFYIGRKLRQYYPGIWAYSDILLLPSDAMDKFAKYCGAFAGLDIFVENAIPMSLLMSSDKIMTCNDIPLKSIPQLYALGTDYEQQFTTRYGYSLDKLMREYPQDIFFIHPIKLSKWEKSEA